MAKEKKAAAASAAPASVQFELDKKKYQVIIHAAEIPGLGIRTALEIGSDPDAQRYLAANCVGSVIEEVA